MNNETDYYYRLDETGTLTFTDKGLKHYRALFAMTGINIHKITTLKQLDNAIEASEPYVETNIYNRYKNKQSLDSKTMIAILDGNQDKTNALLERLKRKNELGLNVLKGH